jgi:glucose uptake protein GlcU
MPKIRSSQIYIFKAAAMSGATTFFPSQFGVWLAITGGFYVFKRLLLEIFFPRKT